MSDLAVDDGDELEELSRTKVGGKRVLLIVVALLVLLLGGGAAAWRERSVRVLGSRQCLRDRVVASTYAVVTLSPRSLARRLRRLSLWLIPRAHLPLHLLLRHREHPRSRIILQPRKQGPRLALHVSGP